MFCCTILITFVLLISRWSPVFKFNPTLFVFNHYFSDKNNLLTPISHLFHLTIILRPEILKVKLTVCTEEVLKH